MADHVISSGPDHAKYHVHSGDNNEDPIDEIEDYWKARYLTAGEATWHILGYNITKMKPAVTAIAIHVDSSQSNYQYHRCDNSSHCRLHFGNVITKNVPCCFPSSQ